MTVDIDLSGEGVLGTYGGCFIDESGTFDDYGIQAGCITLSGIREKQMTQLAIDMINHLILNGRRFELAFDEMGGEIIKEKK